MQRASPTRDERLGPARPAPRRREISIAPGTIWLVTAIVVGLVVVAYVLARALTFILLLFIAIIFAEAIRPAMRWLHRRHVPRPVAALLIYVAIVAVLALLAFLPLRPLIAQNGALQRDVPRYARGVQAFIGRMQRVISSNPQLANALRQAEGAAGMLAGPLQFLLYTPLGVAAALIQVLVARVRARRRARTRARGARQWRRRRPGADRLMRRGRRRGPAWGTMAAW